MADGSSVDAVGEGKALDGLNVTSEIVKEDAENENSWDSFLEDSIDRRAAKALKLTDIKDLLFGGSRSRQNRSRPQSRTESLVGFIYSSMATDIRSAACSVSPSPNRLESGRSSICSTRSASADASFGSPGKTSNRTSTPRSKKIKRRTNRSPIVSVSAKEALQQIGDLNILAEDESILSEPELDFSHNKQTMDVLSAAGKLQERRYIHGGYGTPSSYASEQEMNMYFDNTPVTELQSSFVEEVVPQFSSNAGLQTIALLENKMKTEILDTNKIGKTESDCNSKRTKEGILAKPAFQVGECFGPGVKVNMFTAAFTRCGATIAQIEKLANSPVIFKASNKIRQYELPQNNSISSDPEDQSFSTTELKTHRRNSDSALNPKSGRRRKKRNRAKLNAKPENRLRKMIKSASESVIDQELSDVFILNLTTPDISHVQNSKSELSKFDSFQECLKELRSFDNAKIAEAKNSPKTLSPKSDASFEIEEIATPVSSGSRPASSHSKFSQGTENFSDINIDEACVLDGHTMEYSKEKYGEVPQNIDVENDSFFDETSNICESGNIFLNDDYAAKSQTKPCINDDESRPQSPANDKYVSIESTCSTLSVSFSDQESSTKDFESPIYFERDQEIEDEILTARKQNDNVTGLDENEPSGLIDVNDEERETTHFTSCEQREWRNLLGIDFTVPKHNMAYYDTNDKKSTECSQLFDGATRKSPTYNEEDKPQLENVQEINLPLQSTTKPFASKISFDIKHIEQATCASETESGYGTTTESKVKSNPGEVSIADLNKVSSSNTTTEYEACSKDEVGQYQDKTAKCECSHSTLYQIPCESETISMEVNTSEKSVETASDYVKLENSPTQNDEKATRNTTSVISHEFCLFDVKASVLDSCLKLYEEESKDPTPVNQTNSKTTCEEEAQKDMKSQDLNSKEELIVKRTPPSSIVEKLSPTSITFGENEETGNINGKTSKNGEFSPNSSYEKKQLSFDGYGDPILNVDFSKYPDYYLVHSPPRKQPTTEKPKGESSQSETSRNASEPPNSKHPNFQIPSILISSTTTQHVNPPYISPDGTKSTYDQSLYSINKHNDREKGCNADGDSIVNVIKQNDKENNGQLSRTNIIESPVSSTFLKVEDSNAYDEHVTTVSSASVHDEERRFEMLKVKLEHSCSNQSPEYNSSKAHQSSLTSKSSASSKKLLNGSSHPNSSSLIQDNPSKHEEICTFEFKSKYKGLEEQIERILNPTPSPPPDASPIPVANEKYSGYESNYSSSSARKIDKVRRRVRFDEDNDGKRSTLTPVNNYRVSTRTENIPSQSFSITNRKRASYSQKKGCPRVLKPPEERASRLSLTSKDSLSPSSSFNLSESMNVEKSTKKDSKQEYYEAIMETLQFVRENLNRDDLLVKKLEKEVQDACMRIIEMERFGFHEQKMSSSASVGSNGRPTKVRALEEVVNLLKKHVQQREVEINGLGGQLRHSNEKIKSLEKKLNDRNMDEFRIKGLRQDREDMLRKLKLIQAERDDLKQRMYNSQTQKEDAQRASRKARRDLEFEKEKHQVFPSNRVQDNRILSNRDRENELRERIDELEYLNKSSSSDLEKKEEELESLKRENRSLRFNSDQSAFDLKTDNTIMREKLDRMNEISAENLLLQSDLADYQTELAELRDEAKELRTRCYELTEENRQCKAEIRDLRRYIDLLKSNKTGDSRQDLLNKIEYYQMEHDRLMDEVRRLKHRLGDVSPRSPRSRATSSPTPRPASPRSTCHSSYPGPTARNATQSVRFSRSLERGRSPVSDAMAASSASSRAAVRLVKDRSLSPAAALNIRDLTMERYNQHMDGPESPRSIDSDCTEMLLKPQRNGDAYTASMPSAIAPLHSDDEDYDVELDLPHTRNGKLSDSSGSNHGALRSASKDSIGRSSCRRSCSPTNPGGFRSVSPRMTSTQKNINDSARDRYPTKIKKSLPRRAFAPRSPADLMLGYCIKFTRPGGKLSRGTVKYIGHLPTREEIFIGVELDGFDGKHTGTFQGKKYFTCPTNKGIFTPFSKVIMAWE